MTSSPILKALFAIPQCWVDSDIAEAEKLSGHALRERLTCVCDKPATHVWTAQEHHEFMVVAKACQVRPKVPYEFRVYIAALGAERIVSGATGDAGHQSSPDCPVHENKRHERLMGGMMLNVLRRYRLDELASLYETNRAELERLCHEGQRIGEQVST